MLSFSLPLPDLLTKFDSITPLRNLFSTFITVCSDSPAAHTVGPDFLLQLCYSVNAPAAYPSEAQAFSEETPSRMFRYVHPHDAL